VADAWTEEPTPSATVLLVRDAAPGTDAATMDTPTSEAAGQAALEGADVDAGGPSVDPELGEVSEAVEVSVLEVLLLERVLKSDFAGGAFVFPGGKVDPADGQLPRERWRGPDPVVDAEALGLDDPTEALATRAAAVRETFEEAGVLLAVRADGEPVSAEDLATPSFVAARQALVERGPVEDFHAWLVEEDLVLELGALGFWSWWVTPEGSHRRYDTRFFVATVPTLQREVAAHDETETSSMRWISPTAALAAAASDEVTIIFPTRWNLRQLAAYPTAEAAVDAALAGETDVERTLPTVESVDGVPLVQHPRGGDPEPF
jgi:8-oxo-dGTP pyrophosphatase MutT (NUDIX family)